MARSNQLWYCLGVGMLILACRPTNTEKLTIATAANMQFAIQTLIRTFTEESGIECETVISSSGKLTAQIEEGAPFDLFISADMRYPSRLYDEGFTTAPPEVYAYGQLVLWSMVDSLYPSIPLLSEKHIGHIALANPRTAPYGEAATEVLRHYNLLDKLTEKLVYGESISQTNQFIISKAAELGFTAKSVVLSPRMKGRGAWVDLDQSIYSPIAQGVVLMKASDQTAVARKFYDFLFSAKSRQILEEYGYFTTTPAGE